jgi:hypothetical protein
MAARPKSTRQTSPGSILFIFGFLRVEQFESFKREPIAFRQSFSVFLKLEMSRAISRGSS